MEKIFYEIPELQEVKVIAFAGDNQSQSSALGGGDTNDNPTPISF